MYKILLSLMTGFIVVGMVGCVSTQDINISQVQNEKVNLDAYKTYMAISSKGILLDSKGTWMSKNLKGNKEIQQIIEEEMGKKGKQLVSTNPDFYVEFVSGIDMHAIKEKVDKNDQKKIENVPAAGLAMVLVDAKTHHIIWMAVAEGELKKDLSLEERKERIRYAVKKMLASL
jgi:hypothetical protein